MKKPDLQARFPVYHYQPITRLVVMVVQFLGKSFGANGFLFGAYLAFQQAEHFVGADAVVAVFHKLPVLHHTVGIVFHPLLAVAQSGQLTAHIAEQLLQ